MPCFKRMTRNTINEGGGAQEPWRAARYRKGSGGTLTSGCSVVISLCSSVGGWRAGFSGRSRPSSAILSRARRVALLQVHRTGRP